MPKKSDQIILKVTVRSPSTHQVYLTLLVTVLNYARTVIAAIAETEEAHMLTADQAMAVAAYLVANTPGASGKLDHSYISVWQMP